jgi:hypothetical protein
MKQAYTAQGLSYIRSRPQSSLYYLAAHAPKIIAEGVLQAVPTTYPGNSLSMTGALNGFGYNLTNIKRGMTLWVGSEGARYDTGQLRVRRDYVGASLIEVAEYGSGLVNFGSATSLTVVEDYRIWSIHPIYDSQASRWGIDQDPYTAQTKSYGPQVIMGPPAVGIMDNGKMLASYVGDLSLQHSGSITSQLWTFPNGQTVTSALGSSKNPIVITYVDASPLGGIVTLEVTDSNGNSHIGQRLTFCFGTCGRYQPMDCTFDQITGGYKQGGYKTRVSIGEVATSVVVPDGAKVIIFEKASYGTAGSSVGGNYFGRDNIILVGRVVTESQQIDPFTDQVTFQIESEDGELHRSQSYDMFLESGSAASDWSMASGLTLDRAGIVLAKYRSTIANVVDFHPASGVAATMEIPYKDLAQGTLYDQLAYTYQGAGFGMISFDMQGNLWAMLDAQVTGTSSTLPTIMDIGYQDQRDQIQIDHEHRDTNSQYLIYAVEGAAYIPLAAWSPGDWSGYFGQRQEVSRNMYAPDQDTLITWTGNKRAQDNNPYKSVRIPLVGNNRIDPVPQSLITMSLSAVDDPRSFTWNNRNLIPYEITVTYNQEHRSVSTELVAETVVNGIGGSAFTYPTGASIISPPPPPPPPNNCPPGQHWDDATKTCKDNGVGLGDGNTVYVATYNHLARTRNFLDANPTWSDMTTISLPDKIVAFCLDSYDSVNVGYALTVSTLYVITNLNTNSPTWTSLYTTSSINGMADAFPTFGGETITGAVFECMTSPITQQGLLWLGWNSNQGAGQVRGGVTYILYNGNTVLTSLNNNYARTQGAGANNSTRRMMQNFSDPTKGWVLYFSGQPGVTSTLYSMAVSGGVLTVSSLSSPTHGAFDFDTSFPGSNATMVFFEDGTSSWYFENSTNTGASYSTLTSIVAISGAVAQLTPVTRARFIVNVATQDSTDIIAGTIPGNTETHSRIYRSRDSGATWSNVYDAVNNNIFGIMSIGRWPMDANRVFFLGDSIYYTSDMFASGVQDKIGNWVAVLGTWPITSSNYPVYIVPEWLAA